MSDKIIDAATKLFTQKGFYATSMDDIAAEAGVAKGTLYYHFKTKSQLFADAVTDGLDYVSERIDAIMRSDDETASVIRQLIRVIVGICAENPSLSDMVMMEITDGIDLDCADTVRAEKKKVIEKIASVIKDGISWGQICRCSPLRTANGVVFFIYTYCRAEDREDVLDKERAADEITRLLSKGMLL